MESLVLKFPKSAFSRRSFPSKPPANQLLVWELPQKYFCSIIQHSAARAHIKYIACFFHVDFTYGIDNYIVVMFSTFFFSLFHVLSLTYPRAAIRMCPSGQIKITVQCRWKHMQSVWSSLCLWSSSCLLMTNKSLSRPFTSLRSCQVFWGRSSLQILLTSSDTNLKTCCYPLSGFLFQYMCDVLPRVKDWYRWHASTLLPLCQCQGSVFFFWWVFWSSDFWLFALDIRTTFPNFADENSALGRVSIIIQTLFWVFLLFSFSHLHTQVSIHTSFLPNLVFLVNFYIVSKQNTVMWQILGGHHR